MSCPVVTLRKFAQGERAVRFRPGTALLYRMDVWHRGTPVLEGATRYTHHIGIRHADAQRLLSRAQRRMPGNTNMVSV